MTASFPVKKMSVTFSLDAANRVVQETRLLSKSGSDHRAFVHADVTVEAVATPWAPAARRNAAAAVLNLASVHTYRRRLGRNASAVEKLVQLARADPASTRKDALPALLSLAGERENLQLECGRRQRLAGVARVGGEKSGKDGGAEFFREDGVVDDMDGYLNYLSLEYDSVWDTKPAWCQPWTILLSGAIAVAGSWVLIHSAVITGGVSFVICAWWYIFLYSYPKAYTEMITERRKKVSSGAEDTYGMEKL
ncbi:hypothetical protein ACQ4PT_070737 [Festuca glaucescens]